MAKRPVIVPRIRLETLGPAATRCAIWSTAAVLCIAVALSVVLHLGVDRAGVVLSGSVPCADPLATNASASSCSTSVNGTQWQGVLRSLSRFDGDLGVTVNLGAPLMPPPFAPLTIAYTVEVYGSVSRAAGVRLPRRVAALPLAQQASLVTWQLVETYANASVKVTCNADTLVCPQLTLFDSTWTTYGQGAGGGFPMYLISVSYPATNLTSLFSDVQYSVTYQVASFRLSDIVTRIFFLCCTLVVLVAWLRVMLWQQVLNPHTCEVSRVFVPPPRWLPQQRAILYVLVTTFLWQNPVYVATQLVDDASASLLFAASVVEFIGWSALFTYWWGFVDGLKLPAASIAALEERHTFHVHSRFEAVAAVAAPAATDAAGAAAVQARRRNTPIVASPSGDGGVVLAPPRGGGCCAALWLPFTGWVAVTSATSPLRGVKAYPVGSLFLWPKLLFFFLLVCTGTALQVLAQPDEFFGGRDNPSNPLNDAATSLRLLSGVVALGILYILLLVFWIAVFIAANVTTGRQLDALPYALTRYQQLGFRFFYFQQSMVVLFVFVVNLVPLGTFLSNLAKHPVVTGSQAAGSVATQVSSLIAHLTQYVVPIGELFLVSTYVYWLALCYAPPSSPQLPGCVGHTLSELLLEDELEHQEGVGVGASARLLAAPSAAMNRFGRRVRNTVDSVLGLSDGPRHAFSLITASWLYDMSTAVYFDLPGFNTLSSYGPIAAPPHGFALVGAPYDPVTDTMAWVVARGHRVVVVFRGTVTRVNVNTDLRFGQESVRFGEEGAGAGAGLTSSIPALRQALPLVHRGFWAAYSSVRAELTGLVRSALAAGGAEARLFVTGHSLGGALAMLAAYDLHPLVREAREAAVSVHGLASASRRAADVRAAASVNVPSARAAAWADMWSRGAARRNAGAPPPPSPPPSHAQLAEAAGRRHAAARAAVASLRGVRRAADAPFAEAEEDAAAEGAVHARAYQHAKRPQLPGSTPAPLPTTRRASWSAARGGGGGGAEAPALRIAASWRDAAAAPLLGGTPPPPPVSPLSPSTPASPVDAEDVRGAGGRLELAAHMLLDNDTLEGADPLDCVGLPPHAEPQADLELDLAVGHETGGSGGGGGDAALGGWLRRAGGVRRGSETDVVMYSFGAPRVGNLAFAHMYNRRLPFSFRLVFDGDVVSGVPKFLWLYKHAGAEVWLDAFGNLIVNPSLVEKALRIRARTRIQAHRMASYRRGLILARRNDGLRQFRAWRAATEEAGATPTGAAAAAGAPPPGALSPPYGP